MQPANPARGILGWQQGLAVRSLASGFEGILSLYSGSSYSFSQLLAGLEPPLFWCFEADTSNQSQHFPETPEEEVKGFLSPSLCQRIPIWELCGTHSFRGCLGPQFSLRMLTWSPGSTWYTSPLLTGGCNVRLTSYSSLSDLMWIVSLSLTVLPWACKFWMKNVGPRFFVIYCHSAYLTYLKCQAGWNTSWNQDYWKKY